MTYRDSSNEYPQDMFSLKNKKNRNPDILFIQYFDLGLERLVKLVGVLGFC